MIEFILMKKTKLLLGSIASDLYRVAMFAHRKSHKAAARFLQEAHRWRKDVKDDSIKPYIRKLLGELDTYKSYQPDRLDIAEKYLMFSVILQNYTLHMSDGVNAKLH